MSKKLEYEGLCATCLSAPQCIFRKDIMSPILQCEEFTRHPHATRRISNILVAKRTEAFSQGTSQEPDTTKHKGLCVNCQNLSACTYSKPEGGVWRCEEYV